MFVFRGFVNSAKYIKDVPEVTDSPSCSIEKCLTLLKIDGRLLRRLKLLVVSVYLSHFAGSVWARRLDDGVVRHRVLITQLPDRH